jgi:hypothetical protein
MSALFKKKKAAKGFPFILFIAFRDLAFIACINTSCALDPSTRQTEVASKKQEFLFDERYEFNR